MFRIIVLIVVALTTAGDAAAKGVTLQHLWTLKGLASPESVAVAPDGSLYVSNVNGEGEAVDGDGYVARVSADGKMLQEKWAVGLNAPKGLALKGGRLFATDITRIVEIDAASGKVIANYDAPGAKFLNDAAVAPDGRILASDSDTGRIYALDGGKVSVLLEDARLRAINGLLPESGRLVIVTMRGLLLAMDWKTRALVQLGDGFGDGDGVASLGDGNYLVSEWPGRLWTVTPDGTKTVLIDSRAEKSFINDFALAGDVLYLPHWEPGALTAYRVKR